MFLSTGFTDYELLDCSDGEKLERFGDYILIRPDPQVVWHTGRRHPGWKRANAHYFRSSSGGGKWEFYNLPEVWSVRAEDLTFRLKPMGFKHVGVFPEQAANWAFCREQIARAGRPVRVLNLFAYSGCASIACAKAGASVCHVDASKGMVAWAKENAAASGLADAPIRYIVDDCKKFVEREIRRGRRYDGIIMDPPSYGRGPSGEIWKIEDGIDELVRTVAEVLSDDPLFYIISSYTTGLAPSVMSYLLGLHVAKKHGGAIECDELGLRVSSTGFVLPCGATARWSSGKGRERGN